MITCTKLEFVKTDDDGNKWWRVILTATEEPTKLDLDGTDVDDIASNVRFAAGSVLIAPSSNYIALEDGVFTLKSSGGGGGGGGEDGLVTFVNNSGETIVEAIGYAHSVEELQQQIVEVVPDLEDGVPISIQMQADWAIVVMFDPAMVSVSGGIEATELQGTPIWLVTGEGNATFTVNAE